MRSLVMSRRGRAPRRGNERGAVAILVALSMTGLMVVAGMVLDFGLVQIDRQADKSAADAATIAGLHALKGGDDKPRPFVGVCAALRYLRVNSDRFSGVTSAAGTWTDGNGASAVNGCTDPTASSRICVPGSLASWAKYTWIGTWQGAALKVVIQSGYSMTGTTGWSEDTLATSTATADDRKQGCDQLAVVITQNRKPGFGSLATSSDLVSSIRSVGRVQSSQGKYAPAMLLLKRTGCPVLQSGAAGGTSYIHVKGAVSSNGVSQPGTIHSDSDASGCSGGSNQNIFLGKGAAGVVAYAAPQVANPLLPDATKPGQITSVAGQNGKAANYIRDADANVYGSAALDAATAGSAGTSVPSGRGLVTRQPIDARYLSGVNTALTQAKSVFSSVTVTTALGLGWLKLSDCKPTQLALDLLGLTALSRVYIDCTSNAGFGGISANLTINAGTVIFNGAIAPSATLSLPNATKVYVKGNGTADSIVLGGGTASFKMNTAGNLNASGNCTTTRSSSKAELFVQAGDIKESTANNLLQLCKTTVFMLGGQDDGCVPKTALRTDGSSVAYDPTDPQQTVTAPTSTPCSGSTLGSGQFTQNGGNIDWTAPDQYDVMTLADGTPDPSKAAAWSDPNGPEDLALWSESGTNSNSTYNMSGGGTFNVRGVFMVPNADPFTIGGGGQMTLNNAQFIASTIALNGNTTNITMSVDPNAAVTLPELGLVGLVR